MWSKSRRVLEPYNPPPWAKSLKGQPKFKVKVSMLYKIDN